MPAASERALDQIKTQTIQTVREKLAPLIASSSTQSDQQIVVTDYIDSAEATQTQADPWIQITQWLIDSWKTLGLFVLVLIAMLMLRSVANFRVSKESKESKETTMAFGDAEKKASGGSLIDLQEPPLQTEQDKPLAQSSVILSKKFQSQPEQVALRLATWISQN
jgi:hypothetical protein